MEIVVNDTNILIDLYNAGLLSHCKRLDLDFRTLDVVINEIEEREQLDAVEQLIGSGTLRVDSLSSNQVERVLSSPQAHTRKNRLAKEAEINSNESDESGDNESGDRYLNHSNFTNLTNKNLLNNENCSSRNRLCRYEYRHFVGTEESRNSC